MSETKMEIFSDGDISLDMYRDGLHIKPQHQPSWAPVGTVLPEKYMTMYHTMIMMPPYMECKLGRYTAEKLESDKYSVVRVGGFSEADLAELQPLFTEYDPNVEYG